MTNGEKVRLYALIKSPEWQETMAVWLLERESQLVEILIANGGDEARNLVHEIRNVLNLENTLKRDIETLNKTVDTMRQ